VDQRQKTVGLNLYTRDNNYDIILFHPDSYQKATVSWLDTTGYTYYISAGYKPVDNVEVWSASTEYIGVNEATYTDTYVQSFEHESDIEIKGSNIRYTNLRILTDVIPNSEIMNILNQYYIANAEKLLLADNADKNIFTDNYINKNWT